MALNNEVKIDRSYVDNFSIKKFTRDELIEKFFPEIDVSLRTVGMVAFTTEQVSNIGEDVFNTATVLFRETFPNRAQIPESIYTHAAIFQLSNIFSSAASCNFLLVLEKEAIIKNMENMYDKETGIFHFYIDKNTIINVEDIPYVLDYDIELKIVRKKNEQKKDDYTFSASYVTEEYNNNISTINDPYIKIRSASDGYIGLEVKCHQCTRTVINETIITNGTINYPTIDVDFDGLLAGFDVLYKTASETSFNTQLKTLVEYSQPINEPFCYYQLTDEDTLRITFNSKDEYFSPEYGSELEIVLYTTLGENGNFDVYNGDDISIIPTNEKYDYSSSYITLARPMTSSQGGSNQLDLDALQSLTVMGYRTANALTTEADLNEYYSNYKNLYGNSEIKFIKKRDDIFERIYSAFIIMKNEEYIYKTNTLKLSLNISDMRNPETNIYMLDPGILFTSNDNNGYAEFLRDEDKYQLYYKEYMEAIKNNDIPFIDDPVDMTDLPAYLNRAASFAEFKRRKGYDDKVSVFDIDYDSLRKYDNPQKNKFLLINPFLIRFKKMPNLVSLYMTYISQKSMLDFTFQNDEKSFVQFIIYQLCVDRKFSKDKKYSLSVKLLPSNSIDDDYPIIQKKKKYNTEYVDDENDDTNINNGYIVDNKFDISKNDLRLIMVIKDEDKNICYIELYPHSYDVTTENFEFVAEFFTDDHITSEGKLRILSGVVYRNPDTGDYYQEDENDSTIYHLYIKNQHYKKSKNTYLYSLEVVDDDCEDFNSEIMVKHSDVINDLPEVQIGDYVSEDKVTYDSTDITVPIDTITKLLAENKLVKWSNIINMSKNNDILIPMANVNCELYTLYHRIYDEEEGELVISTKTDERNIFVEYDPTLEGYITTNIYSTSSDPITFLKPLNNVRCNLKFDDYTLFEKVYHYELATEDDDNKLTIVSDNHPDESFDKTSMVHWSDVVSDLPEIQIGDYVKKTDNVTENYINDILDAEMSSLPFIRWSCIEDDESLSYFMTSFLAQYNNLIDIINTKLRNQTSLDIKFYNTYGRSKEFTIGENGEILNTVNLKLSFDMWFVPGTDLLAAIPEVKEFIKSEIETLNSVGMNNLYISNLMRKIESKFMYVDHIRFNSINGYPTEYQTVKNYAVDLNDLTVDERRNYVPEMLVIDLDDIVINDYYSV